MKLFNKLESNSMMIIVSLFLGAFIIYPNIMGLHWVFSHGPGKTQPVEEMLFFLFRYSFFGLLVWVLLTFNIRRLKSLNLSMRLVKSLAITTVAYGVYLLVSFLLSKHRDCFTGMLLFQFVVSFLLCALVGHAYALYRQQRKTEKEIELLKLENLQSRCEALANQINPHFFFNSLNSLTFLVREGDKNRTLEYVNKLSGVFRYILQSDKKGAVTLGEELSFLESFRYMIEVRFADKVSFDVNVPESKYNLKIPILSLLPLIENAMKHNVIDSENHMEISIVLNAHDELVVSNRIHEKLDNSEGSGIGLCNLKSRFALLMDTEIRIEKNDDVFIVYLPLKKDV